MEKGKYEEAIQFYEKLLDESPSEELILTLRLLKIDVAWRYFDEDSHENAAKYFVEGLVDTDEVC